MVKASLQVAKHSNQDVVFYSSGIKIQSSAEEKAEFKNAFFASVGKAGIRYGMSPGISTSLHPNRKLSYSSLQTAKFLIYEDFRFDMIPQLVFDAALETGKRNRGWFKFKIKISNPSVRKLMSGAIAGAVSRTIVAPLETIRTHLMVGSCGNSVCEVFDAILKTDGWKGLFRGNLVNVIRVAPSKAIEVCVT